MVRGVYPPYSLSGPTTKNLMCVFPNNNAETSGMLNMFLLYFWKKSIISVGGSFTPLTDRGQVALKERIFLSPP